MNGYSKTKNKCLALFRVRPCVLQFCFNGHSSYSCRGLEISCWLLSSVASNWPCVQTGSRLPGTVWRGLIFFTTDHPDYHRMPPPAGDNHGWVVFAVRTGFALGHRDSTFHACAHLITTAVRYQLRAQGRYFVPEPNMVGGVTGRSPGERPHDGIAWESPA